VAAFGQADRNLGERERERARAVVWLSERLVCSPRQDLREHVRFCNPLSFHWNFTRSSAVRCHSNVSLRGETDLGRSSDGKRNGFFLFARASALQSELVWTVR